MVIPEKIVLEIAENLDCGLVCYLHKDTHELLAFPDPDQYLGMDTDIWEEDIGKVRFGRDEFIQIEGMSSAASFKILADFVDTLSVSPAKGRLLVALEGRKPFTNFKNQIDTMGEHRDLWIAFKRQTMLNWIKVQLDAADLT